MKYKFHWNPFLERWIQCDMLGKNMYEYPDCMNFNYKFPGLKKDVVNIVDDAPAVVVTTLPLPPAIVFMNATEREV
jgi:hypothetical protein